MENSFEELPKAEEQKPMETMPNLAAEEPKVDKKRPFFTFGRILAVFGVLLIIGTVVGAIIYSRSSERFTGDVLTINNRLAITEDKTVATTTDAVISDRVEAEINKDLTTAETVTTGEVTLNTDKITTNDATLSTSDRVVAVTDRITTATTSVCDTANNWVENDDDVLPCLCAIGYVALDSKQPCVKPDYCKLTVDELDKYRTSRYVNLVTKEEIKNIIDNYDAYKTKNCPTLTLVTETRLPAIDLSTTTETKTVTCTAPLTKQTDLTTKTEYCMCPAGTYPVVSLPGTVVTHATPTTQCVPFACPQLTDAQLNTITETIKSILTKQELSATVVNNIITTFKSQYTQWKDKNSCLPPAVEITCDDLREDLSAAYYAKNWTLYAEVLKQLKDKNCLKPCETLFYDAVMYLSQGKTTEAASKIDEYLKTCTNECSLMYGILSIYAETLSKIEQNQTFTTATSIKITPADLTRLKEIVTKYINSCGCLEMDAFLKDPAFPAGDYFVPVSTATIDKSRINTLNTINTLRDSNLSSSNVLRIAYAQSLSTSVRGVIEDVYNDLCVPDDEDEPDKPGDEPKRCTSLTIKAPVSTPVLQMDGTFSSSDANDYLKFTVDSDDLIGGYNISSSTVTFDGSGKSITTDKTEMSMNGGPEEGGEDIIKVAALDQAGAMIKECYDELKLTRPTTPPTEEEKPEPDPVCRSLEIVSPMDAAEPGVPTFELAAGEYTNKVLEIDVDADAGSVKDYKYSSANGYITFNGDETLYTSDKTVVMNGVIPEGETDTISVWARNMSSTGIQSCHDGFVVTVPEEETPPPTEEVPPPVTITEEEPEPEIEEVVVPETEPVVVPETEPVHAAAPEVTQTGPGVLIYLLGAGLGGALLRRKK